MCDPIETSTVAAKPAKKTAVKTSKAAVAAVLLSSMTRDELRAVATEIGVPRGKNASDTAKNLQQAVADGKLHFKASCTLSFKPADGSASRQTYFGKTLRTYVSGPGLGDQTWLTPANVTSGSPADTSENS